MIRVYWLDRSVHVQEWKEYKSATSWIVNDNGNLVIWNGDNQVAEFPNNEWTKVEGVEE